MKKYNKEVVVCSSLGGNLFFKVRYKKQTNTEVKTLADVNINVCIYRQETTESVKDITDKKKKSGPTSKSKAVE